MRLHIVCAPLFEGRPETITIKRMREETSRKPYPVIFYFDEILPALRPKEVYDNFEFCNYYLKAGAALLGKLKEGDVVFWQDLANASIWPLRMYESITGIRCFHCGIFHSSPFTPGDFLFGNRTAEALHIDSLPFFDEIYVATEYMREMLLPPGHRMRESVFARTKITGLPLDLCGVKPNLEKREAVVFPHRWAADKRPENFIRLARWWKENVSRPLSFEVFTPSPAFHEIEEDIGDAPVKVIFNPSRKVYLERLSEVKFVWADSELETFGNAIREGVELGAIPVLNDMPCYRELYPESIYSSFQEQTDMLLNPRSFTSKVRRGATERMLDSMEALR